MSNASPCIVSFRGRYPSAAQGCVTEMEDVIASVTGGPIVAPIAGESIQSAMARVGAAGDTLLIPAISINHVVGLLLESRDWRRRFRTVVAYVYDCWPSRIMMEASWARRRFSKWFRAYRSLDGLIVPSAPAAEWAQSVIGMKTHLVPLAVDAFRFASDRDERWISVNGYGRQKPEHVAVLAREFNAPGSGRMFHHTNHMQIGGITDLAAHRAWFWKLLTASQIALAYDLRAVDPDRRGFPHSIVGQRWFESLAAGCVVVGIRPRCPEANDLLDWEDATLEAPEDPQAFLQYILELLGDAGRLQQIRHRNVREVRHRHDWAHRLLAMLPVLGCSQTPELRRRLDLLARS